MMVSAQVDVLRSLVSLKRWCGVSLWCHQWALWKCQQKPSSWAVWPLLAHRCGPLGCVLPPLGASRLLSYTCDLGGAHFEAPLGCVWPSITWCLVTAYSCHHLLSSEPALWGHGPLCLMNHGPLLALLASHDQLCAGMGFILCLALFFVSQGQLMYVAVIWSVLCQ